jgi:hypothetical protein
MADSMDSFNPIEYIDYGRARWIGAGIVLLTSV